MCGVVAACVCVVIVIGCVLCVVGCWWLVSGCWLLGVGCWLLVAGCRLLVVGCWLLVVGSWLLVAGCFCWCLVVHVPVYKAYANGQRRRFRFSTHAMLFEPVTLIRSHVCSSVQVVFVGLQARSQPLANIDHGDRTRVIDFRDACSVAVGI